MTDLSATKAEKASTQPAVATSKDKPPEARSQVKLTNFFRQSIPERTLYREEYTSKYEYE